MTKRIVCNINLFDLEQKIYLVTDKNSKLIKKSDISELTEDIVYSCLAYKISDVSLFGAHDLYLQELSDSIYEYASVEHNYNKINVRIEK